MRMRKRTLMASAIVMAMGLSVGLSAQATPAGAAALLARVDKRVTFADTDFSAEYLIEKRDPGGAMSTTRAVMFRRDRDKEFLVLVLEPEVDKGKGYLKVGDNLWLYDPVGKSFTFTSAKERFENSSLRTSDFNGSNFAGDYRAVASRKEMLGKFACTVLDLEATNDRVSFAKEKIWVSSDDLVRKVEDYSLSGQLMRTTAIPTYQKVGDRWVPLLMVIVDNIKSKVIEGKTEYERTTVTISKPSLKALPDVVYTKDYLERVSK